MPKAVLIMNMPEKCADCPLRDSVKKGYVICFSTLESLSETDYYDKKPDWCPLRELPEKKETVHSQECYTNGYWSDEMKAGWNVCLKKIVDDK